MLTAHGGRRPCALTRIDSCRNATSGSTRIARQAGIQLAASTTAQQRRDGYERHGQPDLRDFSLRLVDGDAGLQSREHREPAVAATGQGLPAQVRA